VAVLRARAFLDGLNEVTQAAGAPLTRENEHPTSISITTVARDLQLN
jgi:hypothetical protein